VKTKNNFKLRECFRCKLQRGAKLSHKRIVAVLRTNRSNAVNWTTVDGGASVRGSLVPYRDVVKRPYSAA